jgi:serine/threonine protein kinase
MSASTDDLKTIFGRALEMSDPAARAEYLSEACGENAALRAEVDALLEALERAGGFLQNVPAMEDATGAFAPEAPSTGTFDPPYDVPTSEHASRGERVGVAIGGKYTLVEAIGEGGMGSVWRAKQTEPVKRFVAVKLIKAGMDSKQVLARFEAERQALALMDHPNIAKVLDGGVHDGRPYFVMELVKGVPITEYCDRNRLTPKQRLELFVPVCQAIQHAHQKGIIHRDIKPSNVLVALYDDRPVVKVIDFGVAKATGQALTERTIDTGFGGVVGTPQYMSPEQATFNNLDVDTRSDVYALGVLLYELLTGSPPFGHKELEKRGLLEILRVVREEEPPRPSTRLSTSEALPTVSANRGTEPKKLTGLLRNELDWIVMKSLEKDRARRYETANGFAADVQRYLSGEAVLAHPPSAAYRTKKFLRRYKAQAIAAGLVLFAVLAGMTGTTIGLIEAKKQEQLAVKSQQAEAERAEGERLAKVDAQEKEKLAVAAAEKERLATELTAARLKQIELIDNTLFDIFTDFDIRKVKAEGKPLEYVLAQKLIAAGKKLDARAIDDPLVLASLPQRSNF